MQYDPNLFPLLIVGGAPSLVVGNLRRKLNAVGLEVAAHHTNGALNTVPSHCRGVIVIKDMCSHSLFERATKLAKSADVPCAVGIRKWSNLWPRIQTVFDAAGVSLPELATTTPVVAEPVSNVLSEEQLVEYATVLLHEDPERVLDVEALRKALLDNLDDDEVPAQEIVSGSIRVACAQVTTRWAGKKDTDARDELRQLKHQWLVRWFRHAGPVPTVRQIQDRCKKVFGVSYHGGSIKKARDEADSLSAKLVIRSDVARIEVSVLDRPADPEQYLKMKDLWDLCQEVSATVPQEVVDFFNGNEPRDGDGTQTLGDMHICASPESPFTEALVDLSQFPGATHVRVRFTE